MRCRGFTACLSLLLAAGAMAAAVVAPAEVIANLDFFSDFELLSNLEILEDEPVEDVLHISVSTGAADVENSTETVKKSTSNPEGL